MSNIQSHLAMIQDIINRLSHNSFLLKGWSVALVSSFFALAVINNKVYFVLLAYFPLIMLWILDAFFLWQERLYRKLFDKTRVMSEEEINYSMDTSLMKKDVASWTKAIISGTMLLFHGTIFISISIVTIIMLIIN